MLMAAAAAAAFALSALAPGCGGMHVSSLIVHGSTDWPMAGRTASRTYADTTQRLRLPLSAVWECDLSGGTGQGAAIAVDSMLWCVTLQGEMVGINLITGKEFGSKKTSAPSSGAPVCIDNELYVCMEAGKETIFDYNLRDGEFIWKKNIGGIAASPAAAHHAIVVGTLDGLLFALRPTDGETLWKFKCDAPVYASACADDSLVYCADTRGDVYALRPASGALVWKQKLDGAVYGGLSVVRGILYAGSRDHHLYALDAGTGTIRWTHDCGDRIMASVSTNDSTVVVTALNGTVAALTHTGALRWKFSARSAVNTSGIIIRDMLIVASLDTYVYALSLSDGTVLWKHSIDARIKTTPLVWNGSLIVIGDNKTVYRFASK
jgi:outer membrane protein assembly factor BamB